MELAGDILWNIVGKGILGSLGFGFMGYLLGLAILFVLRAKGLLKRSRGISKVLVISYWIFIPIIFACSFTVLKGLDYAEKTMESTADAVIVTLEEKTYGPFHKYITANIKEYTGESILPSNEELVEGFFAGTEKEEDDWILEGIMFVFLEVLEDEAESTIAENLHIDKKNIQGVRTFGSNQIDGLFHVAFSKLKSTSHSWINAIFRPYYWATVFFWIVLMLFPVIEIIIAAKRKNRNLVLATHAPSTNNIISNEPSTIEEISDL
jgi:hypothetical protein